MRLKNKVAIISGVGNRFGEATAYLLAREGARVVLISREDGIIKEVAKEINDKGREATYFICDATDPERVSAVTKEITAKFGRIDILCNNVGGSYTKRQKLEAMDEEFWNNVVMNNLKSSFLFSKYVIPQMKSQKSGSIINVSSAFRTLMDGNNAYATAKAGIVGMTKNLAREYAESGIKVNCVCPGVIREDSKGYDLEGVSPQLNKKGQSEDVGYVVLFLASDESSWITGQTITVDGGEEVFDILRI